MREVYAILTIAYRDLLKLLRDPARLISSLIFPPVNCPILIFGPCRSCMMVTGVFNSSEIFLSKVMTAAWSSCFPCEKFKRATSIPAFINSLIFSGELLAGPMVAIIFVLRMASFTAVDFVASYKKNSPHEADHFNHL